VRPGFLPPTETFQALAQRVVRVWRGRVELEDTLEGGSRLLGLAGVEVRAPERLEDRGLARLQPVRALEDDRRLRVMARFEQRLATLEQLVGRFVIGRVLRPSLIHGPIVARWTDAGA